MIKIDEYKTISSSAEGFFKDRNSKFYAFAFPVSDEIQIDKKRKILRKKYHDARHHVFAYRLGADMKIFRASDDGEPSNSSGPPVLGVIRSEGLSNILIVVIRYFGGTKLGIPGLINAYKTVAENTIKNADIITKTVNKTVIIRFEYPQMNYVMRIIKEEKLEKINRKFEMSCEIKLEIRESQVNRIIKRLEKNHKISVKLIDNE